MRKELAEPLLEKYADLFAEYSRRPQIRHIEIGDGWHSIFETLCEELASLGGIKILQVKEKFAALTVYITPYPVEAQKALDAAYKRSLETCEFCGNAGTQFSDGWIKTLCDPCQKKWLDGYRPWMID